MYSGAYQDHHQGFGPASSQWSSHGQQLPPNAGYPPAHGHNSYADAPGHPQPFYDPERPWLTPNNGPAPYYQSSSSSHGAPAPIHSYDHDPYDPAAAQQPRYDGGWMPPATPYQHSPPAYDQQQQQTSWPPAQQQYQYGQPDHGQTAPPPWLQYHQMQMQMQQAPVHAMHASAPNPHSSGTGLHGHAPRSTAQATDVSMHDAETIRDAFGVGTVHHAPIINIITNRTPAQLESILVSYHHLTDRSLVTTLQDTARASIIDNIAPTNNKYFNTGVIAILLGPVKSEAFWAVKAAKGTGTNEALLTESIFGRNNDELDVMRSYARSNHGKTLEEFVRSDLSMGTKLLFEMGMDHTPSRDPRVSPQADPRTTTMDVSRIIAATPNFKPFSKNGTVIYDIFSQRTDDQLIAIADQYQNMTGKKLRDVVSKVFYGHAKDVLLYILDGALNKVERDAKLLEDAMAGAGTRNHLLISRLIRIHWDKLHLTEVKSRYGRLYKQDLVHRIRKEIKGSYRDLMIAVAESDVSPWSQ